MLISFNEDWLSSSQSHHIGKWLDEWWSWKIEFVPGPQEQETDYIPLEAPKAKKVKNPLDLKEKNPFVYDSSDSETEETDVQETKTDQTPAPAVETKAVWKENLFFWGDPRLQGTNFF